jgi:hypothetical protein
VVRGGEGGGRGGGVRDDANVFVIGSTGEVARVIGPVQGVDTSVVDPTQLVNDRHPPGGHSFRVIVAQQGNGLGVAANGDDGRGGGLRGEGWLLGQPQAILQSILPRRGGQQGDAAQWGAIPMNADRSDGGALADRKLTPPGELRRGATPMISRGPGSPLRSGRGGLASQGVLIRMLRLLSEMPFTSLQSLVISVVTNATGGEGLVCGRGREGMVREIGIVFVFRG